MKRYASAPPNPPEVFEGRVTELSTLVTRLRSNPLTIVWSAAGIGKTGLVLSALSKARVTEAVVLSASDFGGGAASLDGLGRAIAAELGATHDDAFGPAESKALVLGIAAAMERVNVPIVLEDLHELEEHLVEALLLALARRARCARVVVTTRRRPRHDDLVDRVLALDPLEDAAIEAIARKVRPSLDAERMRAVIESAAGSPRLARQYALGMDVRQSITFGLRVEARELVHALAQLNVPVRAPRDGGADALAAELFANGLVEWKPLGIGVVPNLRPLLRASAEDAHSAQRAALLLALADPRPALRFEAVRLAVSVDDAALVSALLDEHTETLIAHGYAEPLFDVLVTEHGRARSFSHALRLAHALLSGRSLAWARAQSQPEAPHDRLRWCQILAHGGDVAASERSVVALVDDPSASAVRDAAALLYGDLLSWSGASQRAVATLEAVEPSDLVLRVSRDLRLSAALSRLGRSEESDARRSAALTASERLPERDRLALRSPLVGALLAASRFAELERLLGVAEPAIGAPAPHVFATLAMATERGHVQLARRILERASQLDDESLSLRFAVRYNDLRLRLVFGPYQELDRDARASLADERMSVVPDFAVYLFGAHVNVALLTLTSLARPPARGLEGGNLTLVAAWSAMVTLRSGERCEIPPRGTNTPEVELVVLRAHAERALFDDALEEAIASIDASLAIARDQGLRLEELQLLALALDAQLLLAAARQDDVAKQAALAAVFALDSLASEVGSARFRAEAAFGQWALSELRSPAELAKIGDGAIEASSPVSRRRARALMGQPGALDALDRRVVEAIVAAQPRAEAIVLDVLGKRVALPSGAVVDLASAPLHLKILEVLFRAGGAASKAELALAVWDVRKYHPARDDKRMQVAMHRLRHVLEVDPAKPRWLVRADDGYRVAAPMVLGSVRAPASS